MKLIKFLLDDSANHPDDTHNWPSVWLPIAAAIFGVIALAIISS